MSKLFSTALGFLGISPIQLAVIAALIVSVGGGCFAWGAIVTTGHATKAAVDSVQAAGDQRVKDAKAADAKVLADYKASVEAQRKRQAAADLASHNQLAAAKARADNAEARANALLRQMEKDNAYPNDALVVGGADLRRVLDDTAGASGSVCLSTEGTVSGGTDGADRACTVVTLGDLRHGYVALGAYASAVKGRAEALIAEATHLGLTAAPAPAPP
jgi:hypothetical protein